MREPDTSLRRAGIATCFKEMPQPQGETHQHMSVLSGLWHIAMSPREEFAQLAVESGVLPPLLDLLSGKISWVEQRVAVRALGHLASYKSTFESVAQHEPGFNLFTSGLC
ncbi:hypothetical protein JHK85_014731 [Glycine max]|nr:hypothetical protein JHK85_014731 [Glycine max]